MTTRVPLKRALPTILMFLFLLPSVAHAQYEQHVGTMINAYTCMSRFTNHIGYDWRTEDLIFIYRGGPESEYPNNGRGSLVLNASSDRGNTWTGNSPVFNEDVPGNIPGQELFARRPNIFLFNRQGIPRIASLWATGMASPLESNGILGKATYKAGPLGGPYVGGMLDEGASKFHFPSRIVSDLNGNLYALVQLRDPDSDTLTGNFALMRSTDDGESWDIDVDKPVLSASGLPNTSPGDTQKKVLTEEAISMDVSPDGSTLYIGYVAITPGPLLSDVYMDFTDTFFGYVRSTDGGVSWSEPTLYPLDTWRLEHLPAAGLDMNNGHVLPAISTAVNGINEPHFLVAVDGGDTAFPLDSAVLGELILNNGTPSFFGLRQLNLPRMDRFINPMNSTTGPQRKKTIFPEPEWSKTADAMTLVAKWIDADSLFVTATDDYPTATARDSTHDVYLARKNVSDIYNGVNGWATYRGTNLLAILNASLSPETDEKFTKSTYYFHPLFEYTITAYTLMAGVSMGPATEKDIDDLGPAELYIIRFQWPIIDVIPHVDEELSPQAFTLAQNYPNPVGASTSIRFTLERAMNVRVTVSDLLGRKVATLTDGFLDAGSHSVQFAPGNLPAGQYIYRLETGGQAVRRMMSVIK